MKNELILILLILLNLVSYEVLAYKVETPAHVHQYLTNESQDVSKILQPEVREHLKTQLNQNLDSNFDVGDDIITGSGEEDSLDRFIFHFWEPDSPNNGTYDTGISGLESSFVRGADFWREEVIRNYILGNVNESYYWLGRVTHLLEDATVPAHVQLDKRILADDALEELTGTIFINYRGITIAGQQYNYENLSQSLTLTTWNAINPRLKEVSYPKELFKLFWYTAQKTQFFASDDYDGNNYYVYVNGSTQTFNQNEIWGSTEIISNNEDLAQDDVTNSGTNITKVANAVVPHAMRAVAGLYRLFSDAVAVDWPTFHHSNRREGLTLVRGDMAKATDVDKIDLVLQGNVVDDVVSRASAADIDGDLYQDIVVESAADVTGLDATLFAVEFKKGKSDQVWNYFVGRNIDAPPTIANIDADVTKEVVFGLSNGTLTALNIASNGRSASHKWSYTVPAKYSQQLGTTKRGELAYTAVEDVDLDGKKEILFVDGIVNLPDWPGDVYMLEDNGNSATLQDNHTIGNGGGNGAVSIADIDNDGKYEVVVPSFYGVYVFDIVNNKFQLKWNTSDGKIEGTVAIVDMDNNGDYEAVYTTANVPSLCDQTKTCFNRLYIRDAKTGANEGGSPITLNVVSRTTPAIGDIDNDFLPEILIMSRDRDYATKSSVPALGEVDCYEFNGNNCTGWPYPLINAPFISPDIFDIDNDDKYDVIFPEFKSKRMFVVKGNGNLNFAFKFVGEIGSAPAIGDFDNDGAAEIAVKRAGSPVNVLSTVTGFNERPTISSIVISNLTAIAGQLISINQSGELTATDPDGDPLTLYYSSPFNSSGQWQSTVNDTGNYSVVVEASDGNLSDFRGFNLIVFDANTTLTNTFSDNQTQKILNFTGVDSEIVSIRLPKNAQVIYTQLKVKGST